MPDPTDLKDITPALIPAVVFLSVGAKILYDGVKEDLKTDKIIREGLEFKKEKDLEAPLPPQARR